MISLNLPESIIIIIHCQCAKQNSFSIFRRVAQLGVINGLDNIHVRNMIDVTCRAGISFDSHPKCQMALEKVIDKIELEAKRKKLGDLCRNNAWTLYRHFRRCISRDLHGEHL